MITIKDIARVAGVSHTTVSRALNGNPLIKPDTRERIMRIASEMNYVPNYNAKSLVTRKSHTIGLFFSSIDHGTSASFLVDAIKGIHQVLDENYLLTVSGIDSVSHLDSIHSRRYDGILVMSQSDMDNRFIYHVKAAGIPLVVLNRHLDDAAITNVAADDRKGVKDAVDYAYTMGHRRIAVIEGKSGFKSSAERKQGYLDSLIAHGLTLDPLYFTQGDYSIESGYAAMMQLLSLPARPTAVFCCNDDMAIGAMNACFDRGVSIPDDMSILGFDDIMFAQYTNPSLTTVRKPVSEISREGTLLLIHLLEHPDAPPVQRFTETGLIQRRSVACPSEAES